MYFAPYSLPVLSPKKFSKLSASPITPELMPTLKTRETVLRHQQDTERNGEGWKYDTGKRMEVVSKLLLYVLNLLGKLFY